MTATTLIPFGNFIGGQWVTDPAGKTFDDENPARRNASVGKFQASTPETMRRAVDAAADAAAPWARTDVTRRQETVDRFLHLMSERSGELARIITLENGKTLREARGEIQSALIEGRYHARQVSSFHGHTLPAGTAGMTGWVQYEPLGVVGVISPWNFPVNVVCRKALPAVLTGNAIVHKPASYTPWSAVFLAELAQAAGFPSGVWNCVTGPGAAVGSALVGDPRVKAITFTGSTEVGRGIHEQAASNFTRTQLELGGKNALIVMADADIETAVDAIMTAGFACAGQWCTSTSRILVHEKVYDSTLERLTARCRAMNVGDPMADGTDMGPVAGPSQYKNILAAIDQATRDGARMLTGGAPEDETGAAGYYIRPTLFADVSPSMALFKDEVFGPVLAATRVSSLDEAISLANQSVYGLSSGIFTRDIRAAQRYVREIQAGMAHVNMHSGFKDPSMPFGGWKESGHGLPENDRSGLEFFVQRKAVYFKE